MDVKKPRRKFMKQLLALSAFSTGSLLSIKSGIKSKNIKIGMSEADAMDNQDFDAPVPADTIRIKNKGMSCFLIMTSNGTRIITDPINSLGKEPADIVTISCGHYNHCDVYWVEGFPHIYKTIEPMEFEGILFRGVATRHLEMDEGRKIRPDGENYVICFEVEGMKICHLGALGHKLTNEQIKEIGKVDILMAPVGGVSTLPVVDVVEVCSSIDPRVIIPMHYKTQSNNIPGATVDEFLKHMDRGGNIRGGRGFGMKDFKADEFPSGTQQVIVL